LGGRGQTNLGNLGRRKEVEAKSHDLDLEMKEQLNITWGNLGGRQEVMNTVQKRTCWSFPRSLWLFLLNLCSQ